MYYIIYIIKIYFFRDIWSWLTVTLNFLLQALLPQPTGVCHHTQPIFFNIKIIQGPGRVAHTCIPSTLGEHGKILLSTKNTKTQAGHGGSRL